MINYSLSFVGVVKAGSFSLAAKNIGVSKAQISRHIKRLEEMLGIQLLHRTTRSITLTEYGKQFYSSCQGIEEQYQNAINTLKKDFSTIQGTLRITAPIDFGNDYLPAIIHQFTQNYPKINVVLALSNAHENLIENNYDFAIRIATELPDSNLRMLPLMTFKQVICASPQYLKKNNHPKHLKELKDHLCITALNQNKTVLKPQWQFYEKKKITNYSLEKVMQLDSLAARLKLVRLGAGIGRMPDYYIRQELETGKLIELFPNIEKPTSFIYILYPCLMVLPKKTQLFIELLKNKLRE